MRALLAVVMLFALGCEGDPQKCEQALRNYHALLFWDQADQEIGSAKPEDREAMRKQKLVQFNHEDERALPVLVSQCQSANNSDLVDCMINAKTAVQAKACAPQAPLLGTKK